MFTRPFLIAAAERSVKTFAQSAVALIGTDATNVVDLAAGQIVGVAVTAAVVSVLTSIASLGVGGGDSPSLVPASEVEAAEA